MSWLDKAETEIVRRHEEKVASEASKRVQKLMALRGILIDVFGDDALEIIDSKAVPSTPLAYRWGNWEFHGSDNYCSDSFQLYLHVPETGRVVGGNWVDSFTAVLTAMEYCQKEREHELERGKRRAEAQALKEARKANPGTYVLSGFDKDVLGTLEDVINRVRLYGPLPLDTDGSLIYSLAANLVATTRRLNGVDPDYDEDQSTDDPTEDES